MEYLHKLSGILLNGDFQLPSHLNIFIIIYISICSRYSFILWLQSNITSFLLLLKMFQFMSLGSLSSSLCSFEYTHNVFFFCGGSISLISDTIKYCKITLEVLCPVLESAMFPTKSSFFYGIIVLKSKTQAVVFLFLLVGNFFKTFQLIEQGDMCVYANSCICTYLYAYRYIYKCFYV